MPLMGKAMLRELAVIATLIIAAFLTVLLLTVGFDLAAGLYGRQPHPSQAAGKK